MSAPPGWNRLAEAARLAGVDAAINGVSATFRPKAGGASLAVALIPITDEGALPAKGRGMAGEYRIPDGTLPSDLQTGDLILFSDQRCIISEFGKDTKDSSGMQYLLLVSDEEQSGS